jgi:hypothetical protein
MNRFALSVCLAVLLTSCAAYKAQRVTDTNSARSEEAARTLPADPAVVAAFAAQPLAMKQAVLLSELDKYMAELKENGKYDCCVKPACKQCAISAGECHCRQVIDANGPCCGECTQSWVEGRGNTAGVDREAVLRHLGCIRELYDKPVPSNVTPPGQSAAPKTDSHQHH